YAAIATVAGIDLHRQGRLSDMLRPRFGDLTLGALVGVVLLVLSWAGRETLAEVGTPQQAWLLSIYLQLGDPKVVEESVLITTLLLGIVVSEELVWRGWALQRATAWLGERRGWMLATLLYGATMSVTVFTLATPV